MQIDPNAHSGPVTRMETSQPVTRRVKVAEDSQVVFAGTEALNDSFRQVDVSRGEVVARARELVAQTTYPPPETIRRIANLLALHLNPPSNS